MADEHAGEEEETYELEKIISKRTKGAKVQYRIKWAGFPDSENTWFVRIVHLICTQAVQTTSNLHCRENVDDLVADGHKLDVDRWENTGRHRSS